MATESVALLGSLLVFLACFVWFVWDQRRVASGGPPVTPVFSTTINLSQSALDPVLLSLFARFDFRLTDFERQTAARLNQISLTEELVHQIRSRIRFLDHFHNDLDNTTAERSQAAAQLEYLQRFLLYAEGHLYGLRWGVRNPTL